MNYNELNTFLEFAGEDVLTEINEKVTKRLDCIKGKKQQVAVNNFVKAFKELKNSGVDVYVCDEEVYLSYFHFYGCNGVEFDYEGGEEEC